MIFSSAVPILYSTDIRRSLDYYVNVLGFQNRWEWGNPPTFGGVSKDSVEIFFCKEDQGNPGTWLSIMLDNVDEFYESIKDKGVIKLTAPKTMEWGMREMLVQDPDGHIIRFGHGASSEEERKKSEELSSTIRIIVSSASGKEKRAVNGSTVEELTRQIPEAETIAFIAEDTVSGKVIGQVYLSIDTTGVYYVKGLAVEHNWQGKHVGTELMKELSRWLEKNAPDKTYVGLHTAPGLAHFYKNFGFAPAYGMYREIQQRST